MGNGRTHIIIIVQTQGSSNQLYWNVRKEYNLDVHRSNNLKVSFIRRYFIWLIHFTDYRFYELSNLHYFPM